MQKNRLGNFPTRFIIEPNIIILQGLYLALRRQECQ